MAKYAWPAGSTSKTVLLFIQDSSSTTGAGRVSVSAGNIIAEEIRVLSNNTVVLTTVSVTNLTALTDAYLSGGLFPVDPVTTPGWYRFDIPNSALSTGAVTAGISIIGSLSASNIAQLALEIQLQNTPADIVAKAGVSVSVSTLFPVVVRQWDQTSVSSSNLAVTDFSTRVNANVGQWAGTSVTTANIALWQSVSTANVTQWAGSATSVSDVAIQDTTDSRFNVNVASWQGVSVSTNNIVLRSEISLSVVNVTAWGGTSVTNANIALWQTVSQVNVTQWATQSVSASNVAVQDFSTRLNANVQAWAGKSVSTSDLAAFSVSQTVLTASSVVGSVDVASWAGVTVSASNLALLDATDSRLNVNVASWGGASTSASEVAHIKAKTDQLTFTVANQVDTNIESVNAVPVNGTGTAGDPWGP